MIETGRSRFPDASAEPRRKEHGNDPRRTTTRLKWARSQWLRRLEFRTVENSIVVGATVGSSAMVSRAEVSGREAWIPSSRLPDSMAYYGSGPGAAARGPPLLHAGAASAAGAVGAAGATGAAV